MALESAMPAPFVWGNGGARLTPEQIDAQRKVAQAMMERGSDYSPVQSWSQGAARVAQALIGGLESRQADQASKANAASDAELLQGLISGGVQAPTAAPVASPAAAPSPTGQPAPGLSDAIIKVAAARGVDPQYMTRLAMVESGGDPNAANSTSSAKGPFQFINSTAQQYGLTNPTDPAASADAAARLTLDNKAALTQTLGREPTPGELYLAHQQGAGGAAKLLANPDQPVEAVIGAEAARLNGATPGMTAGQFAQKWTSKFGDGGTQVAQAAPVTGTVTPPAPAAATPATAPAAPGVNPKLLAAMSSPYVSEGTKKILGLVLGQQMDAAKKASDPMRQLQMEELRGKIDKLHGKGPTGPTEYGLNPIYGTDEQGNQVLGTLGKDGTFKKIDTGGVKLQSGVDKIDLGTHFQLRDKRTGQVIGVEPKNIKGAESQKALGKAQGGMQASLPSDIQNAEQTIKQIDDLVKNPGLSAVVGPLDQFRPSWTMGSEGRDALARYNQLKGKAFLSAYATLRGGGQITEVEGTKAENAMARMDRAQSEDDFKAALTDFRDAVKTGMDKLREKAGVAAPGGKTSTGVSWSVE